MSRLLYLTDLHLYADQSQQLKGISTDESFQAVLNRALQFDASPDAVILGGDLAQDESHEVYRRLSKRLNEEALNYYYVPGNHDLLDRMQASLGEMKPTISLPEWRVLLLNTKEDGEEGGRLSAPDLSALDRQLNKAADHHVLLVMHHHPVAIGSRWIDGIALKNSEAFWEVVDHHTNVRGLLFGHVHQLFDGMRGTIRLMGTPSCCVQFKPALEQLALDSLSPGFRWLKLQSDGGIESGVERIEGFLPIDLNDNTAY
jgi:Icc protein